MCHLLDKITELHFLFWLQTNVNAYKLVGNIKTSMYQTTRFSSNDPKEEKQYAVGDGDLNGNQQSL